MVQAQRILLPLSDRTLWVWSRSPRRSRSPGPCIAFFATIGEFFCFGINVFFYFQEFTLATKQEHRIIEGKRNQINLDSLNRLEKLEMKTSSLDYALMSLQKKVKSFFFVNIVQCRRYYI